MKRFLLFSLILSLSLIVQGQFVVDIRFNGGAEPVQFVGDIGVVSDDNQLMFYMSEELVAELYRAYQPGCDKSQYLPAWQKKYDQKRLYYVHCKSSDGVRTGDKVDYTAMYFYGEAISERLVCMYEAHPYSFPGVKFMMDKKALRPVTSKEAIKLDEYPHFPVPRYALELVCQ
jgi:hypothetical protein